jgi:threonine synthase
MSKSGVLFRYKDFLPITKKTPMFTMGEGETPLVKVDVLAKQVGCAELYFKLEGCNPTGSFKDRGMVMAPPPLRMLPITVYSPLSSFPGAK